MALYTLVILVRNIVEGIRAVPEPVLRAADGMGYRPFRRFVAVELPLALPGIVAGLRLATVSTVSLISVGAMIGRGALGRMFADGYQRQINVELWAALVATMVAGPAARPRHLRRRPGRHAVDPRAGGAGARDGVSDDPRRPRLADRPPTTGPAATASAAPSCSTSGTRSRHRRWPSPSPCRSGWSIGHTGRGRFVAANVTGLWRAIPTIGVVTLVFRWQPLSVWPVLVALVILAIPPIVLNTVAGIDSVPGRRPRRRPRHGPHRLAGAVAGRGAQRPAADPGRHPLGRQPGHRHRHRRRVRRPRHARRVHLHGHAAPSSTT